MAYGLRDLGAVDATGTGAAKATNTNKKITAREPAREKLNIRPAVSERDFRIKVLEARRKPLLSPLMTGQCEAGVSGYRM